MLSGRCQIVTRKVAPEGSGWLLQESTKVFAGWCWHAIKEILAESHQNPTREVLAARS